MNQETMTAVRLLRGRSEPELVTVPAPEPTWGTRPELAEVVALARAGGVPRRD